MSRSSKGFADFFPTAPSVLQQKKSRTTEEKSRHESSAHRSPRDDRQKHQSNSHYNTSHYSPDATPRRSKHEDRYPSDSRNGAGSSSSISGSSSVFDSRNTRSSEPTPLSHVDSRSPVPGKSPFRLKQEVTPSSTISNTTKTQTQTCAKIPEFPSARDPRPTKGRSKGTKTKYDPEMDRTIGSKEKRQRKPIYEDILSDVSCDQIPLVFAKENPE